MLLHGLPRCLIGKLCFPFIMCSLYLSYCLITLLPRLQRNKCKAVDEQKPSGTANVIHDFFFFFFCQKGPMGNFDLVPHTNA